MAMISCPNCGEMISDKSSKCVHCGYEFVPQTQTCPECGTELDRTATVCPKCGCPLSPESSAIAPVEVTVSKSAKKNFTKIAIGIAAIIVIVVIGAIGIHIFNAQKAKEASEAYYKNLQDATEFMLSSASSAESSGNLIKRVWYNAIYEEHDSSTDRYTCPKGYFVSDFNDALRNLFSDKSFSAKIDYIETCQEKMIPIMKGLQNPPEEYESAYSAIQEFYDDYLELTNLVTNPTGSLQTFSTNFNSADTAIANSYGKMKLYLDD